MSYDPSKGVNLGHLTDLASRVKNAYPPITKAAYDALVQAGTVDPNAIYFVTDEQGENASVYSQAQTNALLAQRVPVAGLGKNLLDNPYFIGGGTSGKFPINQRGLTTYTTEGYAIDRWRVSTNGSARTLTLTSSGVTISKTGGTYVGLFQPLPADFVAQLCGKTVTLSALYGTELIKVTVTIPSTITQVEIAIQFGTAGWVQIWGVAGGLLDIGLCTTSDSTTILAVKLELGTQQTLAHQENGVWVLNEIPDYGEELRKCQRYQKLVKAYASLLPCRIDASGVLSFTVSETPMVKNPANVTTALFVYTGSTLFARGGETIGFYSDYNGVAGVCSPSVPLGVTDVNANICFDPGFILDANL